MAARHAPAGASIDIKGKSREVPQPAEARDESMQAKLMRWRPSTLVASESSGSRQPSQRVKETDLLRDAVLVLQGIDGHYTRFQSAQAAAFERDKHGLPVHPLEQGSGAGQLEGQLLFLQDSQYYIPLTTRQILTRLAELGWLYQQINRCIETKSLQSTSGTIELSLCHNLQLQLRAYDALVASLETCRHHPRQMEGLLTADGHTSVLSPPLALAAELLSFSQDAHLTLYKMLTAVNAFRLRLRMMAVLADACSSNRGGALLSLIHSYTKNGDPFVRKIASDILEDVARPFFRFMASWIYEGELKDPNREFFVEAKTAQNRHRPDEEATLWSGRYSLKIDMLPSFLDETFAGKIFSTGRSLNYLKYACSDGDWVHERRNQSHTSTATKLEYHDMVGLQHSIDSAYKDASQRLFSVFFKKFKLMKHLSALKDYLLLSKGDFVDLLIEQLGPSLSRPANTLYRHSLTATLETAIQGSTSSADDEEVLGRLDARMLEYEHGELGWDVFTLEYKVDAPVDVILDGRSMSLYSKLFTHLWRIKRVEYALSEGWKRIMNEVRYYERVTDLRSDFHKARATLAEMIHFVKQLQYFSHLEVIECSWVILMRFIEKGEGDLDALIDAHTSYINRLATKALLRVHTRRANAHEEESIMEGVKDAFKIALRFKDTLEALCNYALAEASKLHDIRSGSKVDGRRSAENEGYGSSPEQARETSDPSHLAALRERLRRCTSDFQDVVQGLVASLASHPDLDLRFLSCRINFSLFYLAGKVKK